MKTAIIILFGISVGCALLAGYYRRQGRVAEDNWSVVIPAAAAVLFFLAFLVLVIIKAVFF